MDDAAKVRPSLKRFHDSYTLIGKDTVFNLWDQFTQYCLNPAKPDAFFERFDKLIPGFYDPSQRGRLLEVFSLWQDHRIESRSSNGRGRLHKNVAILGNGVKVLLIESDQKNPTYVKRVESLSEMTGSSLILSPEKIKERKKPAVINAIEAGLNRWKQGYITRRNIGAELAAQNNIRNMFFSSRRT